MKIIYYSLLLAFHLAPGFIAGQVGLQAYLERGIASNEALKQQSLTYEVALAALEEASSLRSVRVDFIPAYTLAAGGRTIDIPVGDLLNPVYATLNELTAAGRFPQIGNAAELLNPNNFYDLKFRASYALVNRDIKLNQAAKTLEVKIAKHEVTINQRELMKEIALAYLDCQKSIQAIQLYAEAAELINENIRVNRSLYRNDQVNLTAVLQSETDSVINATARFNAQLQYQKAAAYLNFLTNEDLSRPVTEDVTYAELPAPLLMTANTTQREELAQLEQLASLQGIVMELAKSSQRPQVNLFVDAGLQDFDFNLSNRSPYVLGGVAMQLNLYDAGQTKAKAKQAALAQNRILSQQKYTEDQIKLAAFTAQQNLQAQLNDYQAKLAQLKTDGRVYAESLQLYKQGKINYITLADARNSVSILQLEAVILRFDAWKTWYELKRILAQ